MYDSPVSLHHSHILAAPLCHNFFHALDRGNRGDMYDLSMNSIALPCRTIVLYTNAGNGYGIGVARV